MLTSSTSNAEKAVLLKEIEEKKIRKEIEHLPENFPYKLTGLIGQGSYGNVYKGYHVDSHKIYAIKTLDLDLQDEEIADIQKEIELLSQLKLGDAPNMTMFYGTYMLQHKLWIIMDYCSGGSLRTLMKAGPIEERYIGVIAREILVAMNYLHSNSIIHRDLKAANILVNNDGSIKVCDFGVSAKLEGKHKRNTFVGTPQWMAPEILTGGRYDEKVDIWSFGITIFELANQNPPLHQVPPTKAIGLIPKRPPPRLEGEGNWSSQLRWFVALCLNEKPEDRPTVEELQKSKFIKTAKAPVSIIRDLIHRHREWEARGNVRNSLLYGNRDSIAIPNPLSVPDWDFNTVQSRASGVPKEWGILSSETIKAHSSSRGTGTAERLGGAEQLYRLFDDPNQDQPPLLDNYSQSTSSGNSNEGLKVISIPSFDENGMLIASPPPMISIPCEEEINRMAQQKAPVTARFMPISSAAAYPAPLPPATQTVLPFDRATAMKTRSNRAGSASTSGSRTFDTSSSAPPQTVKRDSSPLRPTVAASAPSSPPRMVLSQTGPTVSQAPATNGGFKSHHLASKSVPTFSGRREDPSLPPVPAMGSSQPAVADATGPHMKSRSQDTTFRQPHLQHQQARRPSHLNLSPPNTSNFNFGDGGSRLPPSPSRPYHTGANIGTNVGNPSTPSSTTNSFGSSYTTSGSRPVYYTIYDVPPIPPVDLSILFPPNPYMMENELNRVIDALADSLEKIFCSLENFAENAQHPRESGEEEE